MNGKISKTLVVGVIFLFIGITVYPVITAVDNDTEDYVDDEPIDNSNEIGTSDEYEEIITNIKGWAVINWIERRGYFRGEVNITLDGEIGLINVSGYRRSGGGIEYFNESVDYVYAYRFIGYSSDSWIPELPPIIRGFALGNIEWS